MLNKRKALTFIPPVVLTLVFIVLSTNPGQRFIQLCFDHLFIFEYSAEQLSTYYPNFYCLVFLGSRFLLYGAIPLIVGTLITYRKALVRSRYFTWVKVAKPQPLWREPLFQMGAALSVLLVFYLVGSLSAVHQLVFTRLTLCWLVCYGVLYLLINLESVRQAILRYLFAPVTNKHLALVRISFYGYLCYLYLFVLPKFGHFEGLIRHDLPGPGWLVNWLPITDEIYLTLSWIGLALSICCMIGIRFRSIHLLHAVVITYLITAPNLFGKLWHHQLVIWCAWILAVAPTTDYLIIGQKNQLKASGKYGFHLKIIWLHFGLIYFFAGFYKLWLVGLDWALADTMLHQVRLEWLEHYQQLPSWRVDQTPLLLHLGGLTVILFELSFPWLLLHKTWRWLAIIGGMLMHRTIGILMYIGFGTWLVAFYLFFIPWDWFLRLSSKATLVNHRPDWKNYTYWVPLVFLLANLSCGIFRIDSYPFSVYPVYAARVPPTFSFLEYQLANKSVPPKAIWDLAQKYHFRWESFSRFEPEIILRYDQTGTIDTLAIQQQWLRWQNAIPELDTVTTVDVYILELPLDPDQYTDTLRHEFLVRLSLP
ncbi:hypothetical protein [Marinoscillum furvescens]|uniref:Vitamin K-dependent gamma-carboxylase-like protein n=1 Tax=Marinoscillum furvescens DSM 4134 TaxID=1122208 RepID=A0A3D9KWB0_MARFU|nr:hypothetical protein [Marinoscillum furvescens]RED92303.1 hypothetical protein C7460_13117 [Marinoscillum furvescens DSM 4134]